MDGAAVPSELRFEHDPILTPETHTARACPESYAPAGAHASYDHAPRSADDEGDLAEMGTRGLAAVVLVGTASGPAVMAAQELPRRGKSSKRLASRSTVPLRREGRRSLDSDSGDGCRQRNGALLAPCKWQSVSGRTRRTCPAPGRGSRP